MCCVVCFIETKNVCILADALISQYFTSSYQGGPQKIEDGQALVINFLRTCCSWFVWSINSTGDSSYTAPSIPSGNISVNTLPHKQSLLNFELNSKVCINGTT